MKRTAMLLSVLGLCASFTSPAFAQVVCTQLGAFTDCSGPYGQSSTQVDLGGNQGVIITDQTTTPYTVLTTPPSAPALPALPTLPKLNMAPAADRQHGGAGSTPIFTPGLESPMIILGH